MITRDLRELSFVQLEMRNGEIVYYHCNDIVWCSLVSYYPVSKCFKCTVLNVNVCNGTMYEHIIEQIKINRCVYCITYTIVSVVCVKYLDKEFTLWDRFEVKGEMTIRQFIDYFKVTRLLYS